MAQEPKQPEPGELNEEQREAPVVDTPRTKAQVAKELHQKKNQERADKINELRISYKRIKEEPAFKDILVKAQQFADYHLKMAKDGVGYRETGGKDAEGNALQETVFFDSNKRVTELDKAAGIEEIVGYLERMTIEENLQPVPAKKVVS